MPDPRPAGAFERFAAGLSRVTGVLVGALVAILAAMVLAQVFFRFVLNDSLLWSEELAQYCNVWITFLGAALVAYGWGHTSVPLLVDLLPQRVRPWVMIPVKLIPAVLALFLLIQGVEFVTGPYHLRSPSLGFSTRWIKLCIPVAGALMLLFTAHSIVRDIVEFRRGNFKHFDNQGQLSID